MSAAAEGDICHGVVVFTLYRDGSLLFKEMNEMFYSHGLARRQRVEPGVSMKNVRPRVFYAEGVFQISNSCFAADSIVFTVCCHFVRF